MRIGEGSFKTVRLTSVTPRRGIVQPFPLAALLFPSRCLILFGMGQMDEPDFKPPPIPEPPHDEDDNGLVGPNGAYVVGTLK